MTSVSLVDVTKRYGQAAPSVDQLSFTIADGEFFTLLGPSGCGKSTTLRMIAGFVAPTEGTIRFGESDVTGVPPYRRDTGMVFQNYALFPHMDVTANVAYGLRMRRTAKADRAQRVREALDVVGLGPYADRRIQELSGGQQQRVALARALVIRPSVLLLDEPLSNLDAKLREETRSQIRQLQQEFKITSVYVTHDQAEAMAVSDRIAVLEAGVLHQLGSPREIYHRPATAFVANFIGRSNVIAGTVTDRDDTWLGVKLDDGSVLQASVHPDTLSATAEVGDEVALSLRPEAIEVAGPAPAAADREIGTLHGRVTAVEFTGSTSQITLERKGGDEMLVSVTDSDDLPEVDTEVALRPDPARIWTVQP